MRKSFERALYLASRSWRSRESGVVISMVIQAATASLFALLTARWLGPSSRGVLVVFMTTTSFLMLVGSLGVSTGGRFLLTASPPLTIDRYLSFASRLSWVHVLMSAALGVPLLALAKGLPNHFVGLVFVPAAATQLFAYFQREALHGFGHHRTAVFGDVIASALQILFVIGLQLAHMLDVVSVCLCILCGSVAQNLFLAHRLSLIEQAPDLGTVKRFRDVLRFSLPALVTTFGQAFVIRGDRLILGFLTSSAAVGLYGVAATLTEVLWIVPLGVAQVAFRRASVTRSADTGRLSRNLALGVTAGACICLAVTVQWIIPVLVGEAYSGATGLTYVLIAASLPMASYQLDIAVLNGLGRLNAASGVTVYGSVALLVGCIALIPHLGAQGAAFASLIAYSLMAILARRAANAVSHEASAHL